MGNTQLAAFDTSKCAPLAKPHLPKQSINRRVSSKYPRFMGGIAHSNHHTELSHEDAIPFLERNSQGKPSHHSLSKE